MLKSFFPAEWYPQSGVQLTWPHEHTDWAYMLDEVQACFTQIAKEIAECEKLLIVTPDPQKVREQLAHEVNMANVSFVECQTNDTWARDHGGITIFEDEKPVMLDFCFNGWGLKFAANYDNLITENLFGKGVFHAACKNCRNFVFEGGSVESNGHGTLMVTSSCLLAPNRNDTMTKMEIEAYLKKQLHAEQVLWINHGYLAGDDTDGHIDTLARFCSENVITYVKCDDEKDEHYAELKKMEEELQSFSILDGEKYRLIPLPMADAVYDANNERLPATYANFLIMNGAVLMPIYGSDKDAVALAQIQKAFPDRKIVGIDCTALIQQHGSLHCVTMQFPEGVL